MRPLPFVWELQYNGVTSYAVGTNHLLPVGYRAAGKKILEGKKHLLVEIKPQDFTMWHYLRLGTPTLASVVRRLDAAERARFKDEFGIPAWTAKYVPVMAGYVLHTRKAFQQEFGVPRIMDEMLLEEARCASIPSASLETAGDTVESMKILMRSMKVALSISLMFGYGIMVGTRSKLRAQADAYMAGDAEKLGELLRAKWTDPCTIKRNRNMALRSLEYLCEPCIIAVGAAHYLREPSMLTVYLEKGVVVRRV